MIFHFVLFFRLVCATWLVLDGINYLRAREFLYSLLVFVLVGWLCQSIYKSIEEYWVYKQIEKLSQLSAQVQELSRELGVSPTNEEIYNFVTGKLSLEELRQLLTERSKILWNHADKSCKFFSGLALLKCAVNPTVPCSQCLHSERRSTPESKASTS